MQRIVTRVIFVPVTSLIFPSKLLDFEPNITSAMVDIARLMAVSRPRSGITLLPSDLLIVGFITRSENYFRKSINLDDPVNPYTISSSFLRTRSYACLGTVHDADDNTIINAYIKQVEDDPTNTVFYLECLQDIGSSTKNRIINQFAQGQVANGIFTRFELQKAYKTLEIDHPDDIDDDGVYAVFQSRCMDAPGRERDFKFALNVIQYYRRGTYNNNGRRSVGTIISWIV